MPACGLAAMDINSGAFQAAVDSLQTIIQKDPSGKSAPGVYWLLGLAYMGQKNPARAGESFEKHLEQNPGDGRAKFVLGVALNAQGRSRRR